MSAGPSGGRLLLIALGLLAGGGVLFVATLGRSDPVPPRPAESAVELPPRASLSPRAPAAATPEDVHPAAVVPPRVECDPPACESWRFTAAGRLQVTVAPDGTTVLVTSRPAGMIAALSADTGAELWREQDATNLQTQLFGDVVLTWTEDSVIARGLDDGEERWTIPAPVISHRPVFRLVRQPQSATGLATRVSAGWVTHDPEPLALLVGHRGESSREVVLALDLADGRELWSRDDVVALGSIGELLLAERDHDAETGADRSLVVLRARDGAELWSIPLIGSSASASPVGDQHVAVVTRTEQLLLDARSGEVVVSLPIIDHHHQVARWSWWHVVPDGSVIVRVLALPGQPAVLTGYSRDGEEMWRRHLPGAAGPDLQLECCVEVRDAGDRRLLVRDGRGARDSIVVALDAATGVLLEIPSTTATRTGWLGLPGGWWLVRPQPGALAGHHPDTEEPAWQLLTRGGQGELAVASADPLLIVAPGQLLRLPHAASGTPARESDG